MRPVLIIAEAGVNHNGRLDLALRMVDVAKDAGADYVKFQTFNPDSLVTEKAEQAAYQVQNLGQKTSQKEMLRSLVLSESDYAAVLKHAREKGIQAFSTAFDIESADFLRSTGQSIWKIPSGELTNLPLIEHIAKFNQPMILSTGMATMSEIRATLTKLSDLISLKEKVTVLHCTSNYPAAFKEINLRAMLTIASETGLAVGYSDHTLGLEASLGAVALGATVIEKHFTLDPNLPGPDQKASLNPAELKSLVGAIRNIEAGLGDGVKKPSPAELEVAKVARKSLVAKTAIRKGEKFSRSNLTTKRPGTGVSPMRWHEALGAVAARDYQPDELIEL